jgi:hypothetical protein
MVQGGGVPSGRCAGPASLGAGDSVVSVLGTAAQPVIGQAANTKLISSFMATPKGRISLV